MGTLVFAGILLLAAFFVRIAASAIKSEGARPVGMILRVTSLSLVVIAVLVVLADTTAVINPGEVGVQHAFGNVSQTPLLPGIRFVPPWASIERFSTREEQWPERGVNVEAIEALSDSALVTQPRGGVGKFRIATVTAFFLRDLQPPAQVVQAINNKIAQEQQVETERHRVEVARLQAEQVRLLNQTLTPEALTKQYLEMLHDMKGSDNLIIIVPTEGGLPILNLGDLRRNLQSQRRP